MKRGDMIWIQSCQILPNLAKSCPILPNLAQSCQIFPHILAKSYCKIGQDLARLGDFPKSRKRDKPIPTYQSVSSRRCWIGGTFKETQIWNDFWQKSDGDLFLKSDRSNSHYCKDQFAKNAISFVSHTCWPTDIFGHIWSNVNLEKANLSISLILLSPKPCLFTVGYVLHVC